jgi:phenylalanyl-tRNA synthetase beta chain
MIGGKKQFKPITTFPKIQRDVNLVMNETQIVGPITDMMLKKGRNLIISANPINIFNDEVALGKGMKSVTFSIEFQHHSKTLEDKDVTPVINEIIRVAEKEFLAKLRT